MIEHAIAVPAIWFRMADEATNTGGTPGPPEPGKDQRLKVALNYLRWLEADGALEAPTSDSTLEWFCRTVPHRPLLPLLVGRYAKLGNSDARLAAFPVEQVLMEKVLIPLHQAKVAFIMGHEIGCIALCGMVGEMLAIFRFQVSVHGSGPQAMSESQQERLFSRPFERIEHSRRIGLLEMLKLIDTQTADEFLKLSKLRNTYLHRLSQDHDQLATQAIEAYRTVGKLAEKILGLGFQTRAVKISPEVLAYIRGKAGPGAEAAPG